MQATALRNSQSSLERSQAVVQTYAILDAMRANRVAALAGSYNMAKTCAPLTGSDLAANDRNAWLSDLKTMFGQPAASTTTCGGIACGGAGANECTISVWWDESHASDATATGVLEGSQTYKIDTKALL